MKFSTDNSNKIIILGYGDMGSKLFDYCISHKTYEVLAVGDNDKTKHGDLSFGIPCISIKNAIKFYGSDVIYIIAVKNEHLYNEIYKELKSEGVSDEFISKIPETVLDYFASEARIAKLTPKTSLKYEVNITKCCNLNCAYCNHYAPLSSKDDRMEIDVYSKDVKRLSDIFSGKASDILILGGEPLLHPDLLLFIRETRKNFPDANITLVTNGILLKKMDEHFWQSCKSFNASITVTYYPIKLDYDYLIKLANNHNVKISIFKGHLSKISLYESEFLFSKYPLNLEGTNDKTESFVNCDLSNGCITLDNGRLYTCSIIPNSYVFQNYFNVNLPKREDNGINIYDKSLTAEDVLKKLAAPVDFCRFCNAMHSQPKPWKVSELDISEWV